MGNVIVDIKPRKEDKDKTIFVFEDTEKLQTDLAIAIQHYHEGQIIMAKTVKKVSFSKGLISREGSELMITEIGKDETKTYNLNKVIDEFIGQEGVSLTISIDDDIPAEEDD